MIKNITKYPFEKAFQMLIDFESLLMSNGIHITHDSLLYKLGFELLSTEESKEYFHYYYFDGNDNRPFLRRVIGLSNFIDKIYPLLKLEKIIKEIIPHLQLLNESSIPQNVKSKHSDSGSNKLIELYFAALCFQLFEDVELDNPKSSKGNNPDIMFNYNNRKWAIACKTPFSDNPKSIFDNIEKGIEQIENSDAEIGFVLINMKNIIDHDNLWSVEKHLIKNSEVFLHKFYNNSQLLYNELLKQSQIKANEIKDCIGIGEIENLYKNKERILPATIFFSQTTAGVIDKGIPTLALQNLLTAIKIGSLSSIDFQLINLINNKMNQSNYN